MIVARLIPFGKGWWFHSTIASTATTISIQVDFSTVSAFPDLQWNWLDAELMKGRTFHPAYMLDQSHNGTNQSN